MEKCHFSTVCFFILVDLFSSKVYTFPMRSSIRMDRYDQKKILKKKKKTTRRFKNRWKSIFTSRKNKEKKCTRQVLQAVCQNISYFNKETVYTIRKKQLIDEIRYYWVRSPINDLPKRFLRTKIFALKSNFNLKRKINIKKNQYQENQYQKKFRSNKVQD